MPADDPRSRALIVQLARLGDLVQSLPAIAALRAQPHTEALDLLCPALLASIGSCIGDIERVLAWEVERWRRWADGWACAPQATLTDIETYLRAVVPAPYAVTFNLNQHRRSVVAATLCGHRVIGPGEAGPLAAALPPWADYLRGVARDREGNRVHLADIFCGLCGVRPPGRAPQLGLLPTALPEDLAGIGSGSGPWVGVVVGAGDPERCIPTAVWREWIRCFLDASPSGQVVLIGSGGECDRAGAIQDGLSSLRLGRVWDAVGRTALVQTAALLRRCQWVIGSDTGPLHLGTAVGARAMGFYFAHARVHETGPYGIGHWVWQAAGEHAALSTPHSALSVERWPIAESLSVLLEGGHRLRDGWTLWESHLDEWGAYYSEPGTARHPDHDREQVWQRLHPSPRRSPSSHEYV